MCKFLKKFTKGKGRNLGLRWLDTVFKNSGVQHSDMFKLRIFRIYSADIRVFTSFLYIYFQIILELVRDSSLL